MTFASTGKTFASTVASQPVTHAVITSAAALALVDGTERRKMPELKLTNLGELVADWVKAIIDAELEEEDR
jgi:hypothetical protein